MTNASPRRGTMRRSAFTLVALTCIIAVSAGCRQQMADMPYHRPYEESEFFAPGPGETDGPVVGGRDGRSARPLELGVIHRGQHLESDPLVTGLTPEEWSRFYARSEKFRTWSKLDEQPAQPESKQPLTEGDREDAIGLPRYDQRKADSPKVYVEEFPFAMTEGDLARGQQQYTIYCSVCHGPLGNGQGKIWERGYLVPTSFHTVKVGEKEQTIENAPASPLGYSRGYALWRIEMPMTEAPIGYYFEVITKGYAGMPSYSAQIEAADRWRIIAYIRALQYSQQWPDTLPPDIKAKLGTAGGNP